MRKKRRTNLVFPLLGLALVVALIGGYFWKWSHYHAHFLPHTTINEVNVGNLTPNQANQKLIEHANDKNFTITNDTDTWKEIPIKELGISYDYQADLTKLLDTQDPTLWFISNKKERQHTLESSQIDDETLAQVAQTLQTDVNTLNDQRTPSKNATIKKGSSGFEIVKEVQGDTIDSKLFYDRFIQAIKQGAEGLALSDFIATPAVKADDKQLTENFDKINTVAKRTITYFLNGQSVEVPNKTVQSWIEYDANEQAVTLNQEKIKAYLTSLADSYNTSSQPTTFSSTKRGKVTIPAGTYSWSIAINTESENIRNDLLDGNDIKRAPAYQGSASPASALIGNTYIEVDLTNQHMYYYKNGALTLETDIVSGKPQSATPKGVFYVWNKERNATLRGTNDDGSDYAEPVEYWLPIDWTGVGIHDSPWQPAYGGQLWQTRGSHGCVNTPPTVMKKLFDLVDVGTPVLVF